MTAPIRPQTTGDDAEFERWKAGRGVSSATTVPPVTLPQMPVRADASSVVRPMPPPPPPQSQRTIGPDTRSPSRREASRVLPPSGPNLVQRAATAITKRPLEQIQRGLTSVSPGALPADFNPITGAGRAGAFTQEALTNDQPLMAGLMALSAIPFVGAGRGAAKTVLPPATKAAFDVVGAGIDFSGSIGRAAAKTPGGPLSTRLQRFTDRLSNSLGPIERLGDRSGLAPSKNPAFLLNLPKTSGATVRRALRGDGVLDPVTREVAGPSLEAVFEPLGKDSDAIKQGLEYITAKRIVGRGADAVGGDVNKLSAAAEVVRFGDADPILSEFARGWESYTDAIGNYAVKSGLWTPELWGKMKNSDALYVRFKRIMDAKVAPKTDASRRSLGNVGPGVDRFKGSSRAIMNPAEAIAEYTANIIQRADRYAVGRTVMDAVDELGEAGEVIGTRIASPSPASRTTAANKAKDVLGLDDDAAVELADLFAPTIDKGNPVLWRWGADGQKEQMLIHSKELWQSVMHLNSGSPGDLQRFLDVTIRPLKRVFTATTTGWSPRFSLATNPSRDIPDALAKTQANLTAKDIARGYYESAASLFGKSDLADEAARFGLADVSIFAQDLPRNISRTVAPITAADRTGNRLARAGSAPIRALEAAGSTSDKGPRLGEYLAGLRKAQKKVDAGEWTPQDAKFYAARLGRLVTLDFSNRPGNPVLRVFADYVPFFAVGLQAPVRLGEAAVRNPKRVAAWAASGATAATIAWALTQNSDEETKNAIRDRNASERSGYLWVPTGLGSILRVPLGQEMGLIVNGVTAGLDKAMNDDPAAGALFHQTVLRVIPNGIKEGFEGLPPVPGLQQVAENARNERSFGGTPIEPRSMENLPVAERRRETTAPTFDLLAAGARKVGFDETSPLKAENIVRGVLSQATPFVTAATDPIAERVMGREQVASVGRPTSRNPINPASAFTGSRVPSGTESENRFYDLREQVGQARTVLNRARRAGNREGVESAKREYGELLNPALQRKLDAAQKRVSAIRGREIKIRADYGKGKISAGEARERIEVLILQRQGILREADADARSIMEGGKPRPSGLDAEFEQWKRSRATTP